jgi:integrase
MTTELPTVEKPKRKRRGYGEGSIFKRADGRWCATIVVGRNERGKRIRRTVYGRDKREAQERLIELQGRRQAGSLRDARRQTVADYLNHWLAAQGIKVRPNTLAFYEDAVRRMIIPHIGGIQLSALEPVHIEGMLTRLRENGVSPRSIFGAFQTLRAALNRAVKKTRTIPYNPCGSVECAKPAKKPIQPYTLEESRQLLRAAKATRYYALFVLAIDVGMRQGEMFGLKWQDVDWDRGALMIRQSLGEVHGKPYWGEPKSAASRRRLSLSPLALEALREHRKLMLAEGHAAVETVFCNADGGLLTKSNFRQHAWLPLRKRAGVPERKFHNLRHTNISLLLEIGEGPKTIQGRAGHAQFSTTMDIYGHLMEGADRQAADRLGTLLSRTEETATRTA